MFNLLGTAQVVAPHKVPKEQSVLNMRRNTIVEIFIKITVPKNTRGDTHTARKPFYPPSKHRKLNQKLKKSRKEHLPSNCGTIKIWLSSRLNPTSRPSVS